MKQVISLTINGEPYEVAVNPWRTLLELIREDLNLTGTKKGCDTGDCGTCTVILNGKRVLSCLVLAMEAAGKQVLTIEGLAQNGILDPLQQSFIDAGAVQCGYCTPGMVLASKALLGEKPQPTDEEIARGLDGNLCRCTGYIKIIDAVRAVSRRKP